MTDIFLIFRLFLPLFINGFSKAEINNGKQQNLKITKEKKAMNMPKIVAPVGRSVLSQTKENENSKGGIQAQSICDEAKRGCAMGMDYACYMKSVFC